MIIIGIAGVGGSGKDTVAGILATELKAEHISLSSLVSHEVELFGFDATRANKTHIGEAYRRSFGADYWIRRALSNISNHAMLLISGIYSTAEAKFILARHGFLVWIDTPESLAAERIARRNDGARDNAFSSDEDLIRQAVSDELNGPSALEHKTSLASVKALATHKIDNSSSVEELGRHVTELVKELNNSIERKALRFPADIRGERRTYAAPPSWMESDQELLQRIKEQFFAEAILKLDRYQPIFPSEASITRLSDIVILLNRPDLLNVIGNQVVKRLVSILLEDDPVKSNSLRIELLPSSIEEDFFSGLRNELFLKLHAGIHLDWLNAGDWIANRLSALRETILRADQYQFSTGRDRGLARLQEDGVSFALEPQYVDEIKAYSADQALSQVPLLELIKNRRYFEVSGFSGAKASLIVHDVVDHLWVFDLMDRTGMLGKFAGLLRSVGDPHLFDIFRREGELVASISYGLRAFRNVTARFVPIISTQKIARMILESPGKIEERHSKALRVVSLMRPDGAEWRSLSYVFSNYVTELDQQKQKFGSIKKRDFETGRIEGELRYDELDFVCMFVELHHELLQTHNKHRNAVFYMHYVLEDYLRSIVLEGKDPAILNVKPNKIRENSFPVSPLIPVFVAKWMFQNYGFTATRTGVL